MLGISRLDIPAVFVQNLFGDKASADFAGGNEFYLFAAAYLVALNKGDNDICAYAYFVLRL